MGVFGSGTAGQTDWPGDADRPQPVTCASRRCQCSARRSTPPLPPGKRRRVSSCGVHPVWRTTSVPGGRGAPSERADHQDQQFQHAVVRAGAGPKFNSDDFWRGPGARPRRQRRSQEGASAQDDSRIAKSRLARRTAPRSIEQPDMIARDFRPWLIRSSVPKEVGGRAPSLIYTVPIYGHDIL
jgi:hypothetical protein